MISIKCNELGCRSSKIIPDAKPPKVRVRLNALGKLNRGSRLGKVHSSITAPNILRTHRVFSLSSHNYGSMGFTFDFQKILFLKYVYCPIYIAYAWLARLVPQVVWTLISRDTSNVSLPIADIKINKRVLEGVESSRGASFVGWGFHFSFFPSNKACQAHVLS